MTDFLKFTIINDDDEYISIVLPTNSIRLIEEISPNNTEIREEFNSAIHIKDDVIWYACEAVWELYKELKGE